MTTTDPRDLIAEARTFDTAPAEYASRLRGAHSLIDRLADALEATLPTGDDVDEVRKIIASNVFMGNYAAASAVVAAGFRRPSEPVTVEWEYRRVMPDGRPRLDATFDSMPALDEGWTVEHRVIAGPWLPVSPEGGE